MHAFSMVQCAAIHNMACCAVYQRSALSHQQTVAADGLSLKLCRGSEQCVLNSMLLPLADLAQDAVGAHSQHESQSEHGSFVADKTYADDPGKCPTPSVPSYQKAGGFCPVHPYNGSLCASSQPAWSAFREPTYGHGIMTFMNSTTARWQWNRNLDNEAVVADSVYITRKPSCSSKQLHFKDDPTTDVYPTTTFS